MSCISCSARTTLCFKIFFSPVIFGVCVCVCGQSSITKYFCSVCVFVCVIACERGRGFIWISFSPLHVVCWIWSDVAFILNRKPGFFSLYISLFLDWNVFFRHFFKEEKRVTFCCFFKKGKKNWVVRILVNGLGGWNTRARGLLCDIAESLYTPRVHFNRAYV